MARALAAHDDDAYAPPGAEPELEAAFGPPHIGSSAPDELDLEIARPLPAPPPPEPRPPSADSALMCLYCGTTLPAGRTVNFCPSCGQSQTTPRCPQCQTEIELGWRHCITCGAALAQV